MDEGTVGLVATRVEIAPNFGRVLLGSAFSIALGLGVISGGVGGSVGGPGQNGSHLDPFVLGVVPDFDPIFDGRLSVVVCGLVFDGALAEGVPFALFLRHQFTESLRQIVFHPRHQLLDCL
jgi:hypothetical protein